MTVGDFAGGFAQAFQQTFMMGQRQKRLDELAKQQGKLIEAQMRAQQQTLDAQDQFGVLARGSKLSPGGREIPQFNIPEELGEITQPRPGLTELLADPQALMLASRGGLLDLGDALEFEAQQSANQLTQELFDNLVGGFSEGSPLQISGVTITDRGPQLEFGPNPNFRSPRDVSQIQNNIGTFVKNAEEAMQLSQELESTVLASGVPFGDFMRAGQSALAGVSDAFGFDQNAKEMRNLIAKRDRLKKLLSRTLIDTFAQLSTSFGNLTNDKLRLLADSAATMDNLSGANMLVLADQMETLLEGADLDGVPVPNRAKVEALIKTARGAVSTEQDISSMGPAELRQLLQQTDDPSVLAEIRARVNELSGR